MSAQLGSNSRDHVFFLTLDGVDWGEYEDVDTPKIEVDGEVRFFAPGDSFETSGGGNFKIGSISAKRHWKRGRDAALLSQYVKAAAKGVNIQGTGSWHEITETGAVSQTPYLTLDVLCESATGGKVGSKSDDSMFEVSLSPNGAPR